jgi:hypothetical protein
VLIPLVLQKAIKKFIMKKIFTLIIVFCFSTAAFSQAREGLVTYQKSQQPAAFIELPYPPDVVKESMNDYLSRKGKSKATDVKGFTTYRNTQPVKGDSINADFYFKVEHKSKHENQITIVSLLVSSTAAAANGHGINNLSMEEAIAYLDGLVPVIEAHNLEGQIKGQNDAVSKSERKYNDIVKNGENLERKRLALEKEIEENNLNMKNLKYENDQQTLKLATLVGKRKL